MSDIEHPAATLSKIEAARLLLEKMGINPADLLRQSPPASEAPAFAEYIPRVSEAVSAGTRRVYGTSYRTAIERGTAAEPKELTQTLRSPELQIGRQIDLEAEP